MINLACVVGARPNFMKMAPLLRAMRDAPELRPTLIHTGQHYDPNLSDIFFEELEMPRPDISLEVGSGKHGAQTARILERMEEVLEKGPPGGGRYDRLVVVGDVTSTMAAALAAVKLEIPVAHVEAGLRSFDRAMPEEINRIVTDSISDMLFVSEPAGVENLKREGHPDANVHLVGNVMIDTLLRLLPKAKDRPVLDRLGLKADQYVVVTLHRPSNVDSPAQLGQLVDALIHISKSLPIAFPVHPRTTKRLDDAGLLARLAKATAIRVLPPLGYLDFMALTSQARIIVTDSGGLQEESTALGIPCLTMRTTTERPYTLTDGTSALIGEDCDRLRTEIEKYLPGSVRSKKPCPPLWDGAAAPRIVRKLASA